MISRLPSSPASPASLTGSGKTALLYAGVTPSGAENPQNTPLLTHSSSVVYTGKSPKGAKFAALALLLTACGKTENVQTAPSPAPKLPPAVSTAKLDSEIMDALAEPADDPLDNEVTALRRRHSGKNAEELLQTPEVKAKLGEVLKELSQRKDLQDRINSSIAAAAALKGLDSKPGSHAFKLDVKRYSDARTHDLLKAVMSGRAVPVVDFLVGEVGEATPDLTLGGLQQSSNGISIDPISTPGKP